MPPARSQSAAARSASGVHALASTCSRLDADEFDLDTDVDTQLVSGTLRAHGALEMVRTPEQRGNLVRTDIAVGRDDASDAVSVDGELQHPDTLGEPLARLAVE